MKMELAQTSLFGELFQRRLLKVVLVEKVNYASDSVVVIHAQILLCVRGMPTRFLPQRGDSQWKMSGGPSLGTCAASL